MKSDRTAQRRAAILAALEQGYSATFAQKAAGLDRAAYDAWLAEDGAFATACKAAMDAGTDILEDLARERVATGGDSLLMFLLKSRRPEIYRERHEHQVDANIASGVLIAPAAVDLETWAHQAREQQAGITEVPAANRQKAGIQRQTGQDLNKRGRANGT